MNNGFSKIVFKVSVQRRGHTFSAEVLLFFAENIHHLNMDFFFLIVSRALLIFFFFLVLHTASLRISPVLSFQHLVLHQLVDLTEAAPEKLVTSPSPFPLLLFFTPTILSPTCHLFSLIRKCYFPLSTLRVSNPLLSPWCTNGHHGNCQANEGWHIGPRLGEGEVR